MPGLRQAGEAEDGVQLDPVRSDARLPVQEVEEGDADHTGAARGEDVEGELDSLPPPVARRPNDARDDEQSR